MQYLCLENDSHNSKRYEEMHRGNAAINKSK